jgi:hypothetical protein
MRSSSTSGWTTPSPPRSIFRDGPPGWLRRSPHGSARGRRSWSVRRRTSVAGLGRSVTEVLSCQYVAAPASSRRVSAKAASPGGSDRGQAAKTATTRRVPPGSRLDRDKAKSYNAAHALPGTSPFHPPTRFLLHGVWKHPFDRRLGAGADRRRHIARSTKENALVIADPTESPVSLFRDLKMKNVSVIMQNIVGGRWEPKPRVFSPGNRPSPWDRNGTFVPKSPELRSGQIKNGTYNRNHRHERRCGDEIAI